MQISLEKFKIIDDFKRLKINCNLKKQLKIKFKEYKKYLKK